MYDFVTVEKIAVVHDESNMDRAVGQQRARVKMTSAMKKANKQAESGKCVVHAIYAASQNT